MEKEIKNLNSLDFEELDLILELENIKNKNLKSNIYMKLKSSLIPDWIIKNPDSSIIYKESINQISPIINNDNFLKSIIQGYNITNEFNGFEPDYPLENDSLNILDKLNSYGIKFDMKFTLDYIIKIYPNEVIFPMCCVGKNRSQYLFYYLKNLQALYPNYFVIGYPSSGDELSILGDVENNKINKNVLSSFSVQYKKDSFSDSVGKSFGICRDNNKEQLARSIHVFDKILKINECYTSSEITNFENFKYKNSKYNIFEKNDQNYLKIKKIFIKYFLTPNNLIDVINHDIPTKINKITWICVSDKSFYNLCKILYYLKQINLELEFENVRIVYFGISDIFQKSNIKPDELIEYKNKFIRSFQFVK